MKAARRLTAIIERHDEGFVALCPEPDVASEGASIEEARANLIEALTLVSDIAAVLAKVRQGTEVVVEPEHRAVAVIKPLRL